MQDELPLTVYVRVPLARAAFPLEIVAVPVTPQGVDVDDGERSITLLGNDYFDGLAPVVNERVSIEEILPARSPPLTIVAAPREDPFGRVVTLIVRRPRPNHIRVKDRDQRFRVLLVPRHRFAVNSLLDSGSDVGIAHTGQAC